jgi:putative toxin-antitoxin system antitoxin component (TIGR02293 family)
MEATAPGRAGKAKAAVVKGKGVLFKTRYAAKRYKATLEGKSTDLYKSTLVASLLTGGASPDDLGAVYRVTKEGITIGALTEFTKSLQMFNSDYLLMTLTGLSERTIQRRQQKPAEPLNSEQSARAFLGAQILEQAIRVIGTPKLAEAWMSKPAIGLDGRRPIDLLDNSIGTQLVSDFLTRLEYGVYQ